MWSSILRIQRIEVTIWRQFLLELQDNVYKNKFQIHIFTYRESNRILCTECDKTIYRNILLISFMSSFWKKESYVNEKPSNCRCAGLLTEKKNKLESSTSGPSDVFVISVWKFRRYCHVFDSLNSYFSRFWVWNFIGVRFWFYPFLKSNKNGQNS